MRHWQLLPFGLQDPSFQGFNLTRVPRFIFHTAKPFLDLDLRLPKKALLETISTSLDAVRLPVEGESSRPVHRPSPDGGLCDRSIERRRCLLQWAIHLASPRRSGAICFCQVFQPGLRTHPARFDLHSHSSLWILCKIHTTTPGGHFVSTNASPQVQTKQSIYKMKPPKIETLSQKYLGWGLA